MRDSNEIAFSEYTVMSKEVFQMVENNIDTYIFLLRVVSDNCKLSKEISYKLIDEMDKIKVYQDYLKINPGAVVALWRLLLATSRFIWLYESQIK